MLSRLMKGFRSIRVRITAIVVLCWLLPTLVLGVYMSSIFFAALREKTEQALASGATHAQEAVIGEIDRILKKSKDVTYDEQLTEFTTKYRSGALRYEQYYSQCRTYWQRMFQREPIMGFTAFFPVETPVNLIYTVEDVNELVKFRRDVLPRVETLGETLDTRSRFIYASGSLYHVRNLYTRKLQRFGMMVLEIDPEMLFAPLLDTETLWQGQVDLILDEYRYNADEDRPFYINTYHAGLHEDRGDLLYSYMVKTSDYTFGYRIRLDQSVMFGQADEYYRIITALIVLLLPIVVLILLFMHRSLTKPLLNLSRATERMAGGELGITVPTRGAEEISNLGMAFNAMSLQMQQLIDKSYREEIALRDARIAALQSRINPHFLNNALEMMNWQARMDGADCVGQMIEAMSTLLNAALDRENERTVPLSQELEVTDAYIFFVQQRFDERLHIEKVVDPALLRVQVPRLIIQTLMENAIEHGIAPLGGGTVRLHIYVEEETLYVDVRNEGRPLSEAERRKVAWLLDSENHDTRLSNIGIHNINQRLQLIYAGQAGLSLSVDERGETLARIHIPYAGDHAK